jgi:hypothetical protein
MPRHKKEGVTVSANLADADGLAEVIDPARGFEVPWRSGEEA